MKLLHYTSVQKSCTFVLIVTNAKFSCLFYFANTAKSNVLAEHVLYLHYYAMKLHEKPIIRSEPLDLQKITAELHLSWFKFLIA